MEAIIIYHRKIDKFDVRIVNIILKFKINCFTEWKKEWRYQHFNSSVLNLLYNRLEELKNSTTKNLNIYIIRGTFLGGKALRGKVILEKIKDIGSDIDLPAYPFPSERYIKEFRAPRKINLPISVDQLITILNDQEKSSNTNKKELLNALLFLRSHNII